MDRRFLIGAFAVFVAWMAGSYLVHGVLLHPDYALLPDLYRTESDSQRLFPFLIGAHVVLAGAFTWIYSRGVEAAPWMAQGFRFGVAVALLTMVPTYTIYYVVQPIPGAMVVKQIALDSGLIVLLGLLIAFIYRRRRAA